MTTMMAIPTKIRFNDEWRIDLAATGDGLVAQLPNGVRVSARAPKLAKRKSRRAVCHVGSGRPAL